LSLVSTPHHPSSERESLNIFINLENPEIEPLIENILSEVCGIKPFSKRWDQISGISLDHQIDFQKGVVFAGKWDYALNSVYVCNLNTTCKQDVKTITKKITKFQKTLISSEIDSICEINNKSVWFIGNRFYSEISNGIDLFVRIKMSDSLENDKNYAEDILRNECQGNEEFLQEVI
jgi:hypothetical protein